VGEVITRVERHEMGEWSHSVKGMKSKMTLDTRRVVAVPMLLISKKNLGTYRTTPEKGHVNV
jgi:hypothetical protein